MLLHLVLLPFLARSKERRFHHHHHHHLLSSTSREKENNEGERERVRGKNEDEKNFDPLFAFNRHRLFIQN